MSHGKSPANIDVVADVLGQLLEVVMPRLIAHGPVSHQWPKPNVTIDFLLLTLNTYMYMHIKSKIVIAKCILVVSTYSMMRRGI
jgi:hypothetical protein